MDSRQDKCYVETLHQNFQDISSILILQKIYKLYNENKHVYNISIK